MPTSTPLPPDQLLAHSLIPGDSAGFFVGVREMKDPMLTSVEFAADDAIDLAHVFSLELGLIAPRNVVLALAGEPVKDSTRARRAALLDAGAHEGGASLYELHHGVHAAGSKTGPRGLFVLSFAGHGFSSEGNNIFCASDTYFRRTLHTGFRLDALTEDLLDIAAERRLLLIDACRNRLTQGRHLNGDHAYAATEEFLTAFAEVQGLAALFSATQGGYSYDDPLRRNGLFSGAVVEGLRGAALSNERFLTVQALASYVQEKVLEWGRLNLPAGSKRREGIHPRFDPAEMASLPLAFHPEFHQRYLAFVRRRGAALERLKVEIEPPLTGGHLDWVKAALAVAVPTPQAELLLTEIERLDGSLPMRRSLAMFLQESPRGAAAPASAPGSSFPTEIAAPTVRAAAPSVRIVAAEVTRPAWANAASRDTWGWWADLKVESAVQRFRFIPPGEFQLGSDVHEKGRYGNEGPTARVEITSGFWLADTPCCQWLWQEVMGRNPSRFRSPDRPVEQVSWHDIEAFLVRLNHRWPDLDLGVPNEVQWEFASRAGTSTATYAGNLEIHGINDAPVLEEIAWYAGNSGREFDLDVGEDARHWPERRHADPHAGTRRVGQKKPNAWGLFDTLGNVWEWCRSDWQEQYHRTTGDVDGPVKTIRGASWASNARNVRAACRTWRSASKRDFDLGFRLAIGLGNIGRKP